MQHRLVFALGLFMAGLAFSAPARAATRRLAVVVGNNAGGPTEKPLHYAEEDSTKVADVLAQLGDVHPENLFVLKARGKSDLSEVLKRVTERVAEYRQNPEDRTVFIFYYSGHSDGEALELGTERVPYTELRAWIAATRADVRIVILDGCKSGALVQSKGGKPAPPFEIKLTDQLDATGEALLTSSAADELALESREIRGSFFTHHFVSGLRGAADASGDGRITLSEAYQYAFDHTLAATASTGLRQHPGYDYRLAGKGELVLTEVTQPSASLELPEGYERALILLIRRDQVLAELGPGPSRRVALAPGEYAVRIWKGTEAYAARVTVEAGEAKQVAWSDLKSLASPPVAGKGLTSEPPGRGLSWGLTIGGGAVMAGSLVVLLSAMKVGSDYEKQQSGTPGTATVTKADADHAKKLYTAGWLGIAAGGALATWGIVRLVSAPAAPAVGVRPTAGGAMLSLGGSF